MSILNEISEYMQKGRAKNVKQLVAQALDDGIEAKVILDDALLAGMAIVGEKFKNNEVFVPEVLVAARAMNMGIDVLKPKLAELGDISIGKAVIGTVKGDLHDIGKNLVTIMLRGSGFEVTDLGTDVAPETYIEEAEKIGADIICMSALLTTTMPRMKDVVELLKEKGLRDKYTVMIGGAPVTQSYCDEIGADFYTTDAASCSMTAKQAVMAS